MTKLDAALLKLEGALDYTVDPHVRAWIDVAQQAIEAAKEVMAADTPLSLESEETVCLGEYSQAA
jgi:hypothetical protein